VPSCGQVLPQKRPVLCGKYTVFSTDLRLYAPQNWDGKRCAIQWMYIISTPDLNILQPLGSNRINTVTRGIFHTTFHITFAVSYVPKYTKLQLQSCNTMTCTYKVNLQHLTPTSIAISANRPMCSIIHYVVNGWPFGLNAWHANLTNVHAYCINVATVRLQMKKNCIVINCR
jgi:hypothetical protein